MKKNLKEIIVLIVLTIGMTSCSNSNVSQDNSSNLNYDTDFPAQTNPNTDQFETGYEDFGIGVTPEQDYSNIICYTENEQYHSDVDKIVVTIKNQNSGKGFYYYAIPYVEKKLNGEWLRLNYNEKAQERFSMERDWWEFCGIPDNNTIPFSTNITLSSDDLEEKFTSGEYQMVIYVGKEIKYAPFAIVN